MRYFFNIYVYFSLVFLFFIKHFVLIFLILQELQGDFFICFIYKFNSFVYLSRFVFYISVYSPLFSVNLYLISYICYILHIYFSSFLLNYEHNHLMLFPGLRNHLFCSCGAGALFKGSQSCIRLFPCFGEFCCQ